MIEKLSDEKELEMAESLREHCLEYNGLLKSVAMLAIQKARDYYDAQIDKQAKTMDWVSVKDRRPECGISKDERCGWLVYRPKANQKKFVIEYTHPEWWYLDDKTSAEITHWMLLPIPPVEL